MIHVTFAAMGTGIDAWCPDPESAAGLRDWFEEVETVCSRFRPDSELSRVNRSAADEVVVSSLLAEVMTAADRMRSLTDGLVDVGVGAGVSDWGYDKSFEEGLGLDEVPWLVPFPYWSLDGRRLARSPGTAIDLGGVAKGWSCDRAVERGLATVVSAGGDIRSDDPGTIVSVVDPWGEIAVRLRLGVGALATSSTTRRRWKVGNREVCHLIDPRTMAPIDTPILSASVLVGSALEAEAAAKAVLLRGEDGLAWAAETAWVDAAVVVWHDGSVYATPGIDVAA
ncbi:MAG: FAD:protein FMN transferase [Acidimicrobiia bacterium]|jgi:FAD:protein FMN transferase